MTVAAPDDAKWMARALDLARAQLGRTAPNPSVGCVIVANGEIVGEAATGEGGRPHAEEAALAIAGDKAVGATAYVTLEPCSERSSGTPSCSEHLINASVSRVVAACLDPHPQGSGGLDRLRAAGVVCEVGVLRDNAEAVNAGFFKVVRDGRPLVSLDPSADSYDGEFYLGRGESFEAALARMAQEGLTRIRVSPSSPLAAALKSRGLVDVDRSGA
ncbi:MAG: bifunctional diaminohydroxyphosphoribosylaminopyrimidine deaminase/5-amino-6-(5-phosphoribosylamino)uracil reductase RibD [Pseudomonadota bacterium]